MMTIKKISMVTCLMLSIHNMVAMDKKNVTKNVVCHIPEVAWFAAKAIPQYMPTVFSTAPFVLNGPGAVVQGVCMAGSILMHHVTEKDIHKSAKKTIQSNVHIEDKSYDIAFPAPLVTILLQLGLQISVLCYQKRMTGNAIMSALLYSGISILPWAVKVYCEKTLKIK